jgi:hypothetical protein
VSSKVPRTVFKESLSFPWTRKAGDNGTRWIGVPAVSLDIAGDRQRGCGDEDRGGLAQDGEQNDITLVHSSCRTEHTTSAGTGGSAWVPASVAERCPRRGEGT